jgi:hypothetical protein
LVSNILCRNHRALLTSRDGSSTASRTARCTSGMIWRAGFSGAKVMKTGRARFPDPATWTVAPVTGTRDRMPVWNSLRDRSVGLRKLAVPSAK